MTAERETDEAEENGGGGAYEAYGEVIPNYGASILLSGSRPSIIQSSRGAPRTHIGAYEPVVPCGP